MKHGIRWLSGFMAILLVSACLITTGFAVDSVAIQLTAPSVVESGDAVAVTVSSTDGGFSDGKLVFTYDAAKLTFKGASVEEPWASAANVVLSVNDRLIGRVVLAFAGTQDAPAGDLLTLNFVSKFGGVAKVNTVAAESYISGAGALDITPSVSVIIEEEPKEVDPGLPPQPPVDDDPDDVPLPTDPSDPKPSEDPEAKFPFVDVLESDWFYGDVKHVWEEKLMQGTSATTFEPLTTTTRGMITTILYRMEGEPAIAGSSPFSDVVAGEYYANAIVWANKHGILRGYDDGRAGPNDIITREQFAAILYRYADYKKQDVSARADLSSYTDVAEISDYAVDAVAWANAKGFIIGVSETELAPKASATRSQAAAIIWRYYSAFKA